MENKKSRLEFSTFVSAAIDLAGINEHIKCTRLRAQKHFTCKISNMSECPKQNIGNVIFTGSTSEGIIPMLISDIDCMHVFNDIICVDDANGDTNNAISILKAVFEDEAPGYAKVVPVQINIDKDNIDSAASLCSMSYLYKSGTNDSYISSAKFQNHFKQIFEYGVSSCQDNGLRRQTEYSGPAITSKLVIDTDFLQLQMLPFGMYYDNVIAIYYYNSSILNEWSKRPRIYDWPPKEVIEEVSVMEGFILPVGEKESNYQALEWRISFVTAEKRLLTIFNSTHDKLYVVLKLFAKHVFTSVSKSFSSYMVKNVMLWMAERNPSWKFRPDLFIDQFLQCLNFVKHCLQNNHLPNYITPKRNLLANRLFGEEKQHLIKLLSKLIGDEDKVIHRLPKLSEHLYYVSCQPELHMCYGLWRNYVETVFLNANMCLVNARVGPNTPARIVDVVYQLFQRGDERWAYHSFLLLKLLVPDFQDRVLQFERLVTVFQERLLSVFSCCFLQ